MKREEKLRKRVEVIEKETSGLKYRGINHPYVLICKPIGQDSNSTTQVRGSGGVTNFSLLGQDADEVAPRAKLSSYQ